MNKDYHINIDLSDFVVDAVVPLFVLVVDAVVWVKIYMALIFLQRLLLFL